MFKDLMWSSPVGFLIFLMSFLLLAAKSQKIQKDSTDNQPGATHFEVHRDDWDDSETTFSSQISVISHTRFRRNLGIHHALAQNQSKNEGFDIQKVSMVKWDAKSAAFDQTKKTWILNLKSLCRELQGHVWLVHIVYLPKTCTKTLESIHNPWKIWHRVSPDQPRRIPRDQITEDVTEIRKGSISDDTLHHSIGMVRLWLICSDGPRVWAKSSKPKMSFLPQPANYKVAKVTGVRKLEIDTVLPERWEQRHHPYLTGNFSISVWNRNRFSLNSGFPSTNATGASGAPKKTSKLSSELIACWRRTRKSSRGKSSLHLG